MNWFSLIFLPMLFALPAGAHDGETHDEPAPVVAPVAGSPRLSASSADFELVASFDSDEMTVWLDRYASNEPVSDAIVEVEGASLQGNLSHVAAGVYRLKLKQPLPAQKHLLTFTVQSGDSADLLPATLDLSLPAGSETPVRAENTWLIWVLAALGLLAAAGGLFRHHRKTSK